jgi:NAD(P) transhydrogenase
MMLGDDAGLLKLLFHRCTRELLGVHAIGLRATEIIHIGQAVMFHNESVEYFRDMVFHYPNPAGGAQGRSTRRSKQNLTCNPS